MFCVPHNFQSFVPEISGLGPTSISNGIIQNKGILRKASQRHQTPRMHPLQLQEVVHTLLLIYVCLAVAAVVWLLCHSPRHLSPSWSRSGPLAPSHFIASAPCFLLSVIPSSSLTGKVLLVFLFPNFVVSDFLITQEHKLFLVVRKWQFSINVIKL